MRNRPTPIYASNDAGGSNRSAWDVDAEPGMRLFWLFVAMGFPLLVVAGRLTQLQWLLADDFAVEEHHEVIAFEPIPSRHGRILSADGTVLAFDEERFQVLMHYRWLEEPPNDGWLREEALSRLSRLERRDKTKIAAAKQQVLARRAALWQSLAELTDHNADLLTERRSRIQQRVERMFHTIEARSVADAASVSAMESAEATHETADGDAIGHGSQLLRRGWGMVVKELTTPPTREQRQPLRIPEQSDYHVLLEDVPLEVVAEIESNPQQFRGLRTEVTTRRVYPHGRLAPHLVGYRSEIDADGLAARKARFPKDDPLDYQPGDTIGKSGIEAAYEYVLRGVRGQRKIVRDRHGAITHSEIVRGPRLGRDVVLSFSTALQAKVSDLLTEIVDGQSISSKAVGGDESGGADAPSDKTHRPPGGCIVAIDVHSGAILAAATAPTFDVNDFLSGGDEQRAALFNDSRDPLFPRATQMTLPPGSVFKTVSAVAVLESGRIDPDRAIDCSGYLDNAKRNRCYIFTHYGVGHHETDLTKAIAQSCNVYFFTAARTIGPQPLVDWADRLGFGKPTGVDLPGERSGHVPRPPDQPPTSLANRRSRAKSSIELASHEHDAGDDPDVLLPASPWDDDSPNARSAKATSTAKRETWYAGDTLGLAIGQSRLTVTPLQIARLMAVVANDGWLVTPHVAREIAVAPETATDDADVGRITNPSHGTREPVSITPSRQRIRGLSSGTLARLREGLEQVVAHPQGTGYKTVRMNEVAIAGKTGTAEIGGGRPDHAWFAGYVPANDPQVAFVVVLEQAGSGGKVAGPVAKKLVQTLLEQGTIRAK